MTAELRRLLSEATPGPWRSTPSGDIPGDDGDGGYVATVVADDDSAADAETTLVAVCWAGDDGSKSDPDAALIVAAVNALPALLDVAEAARLVSQWHDSIGSGPVEVLNAELGHLRDLCARLEATR